MAEKIDVTLTDEEWDLLMDVFDYYMRAYPGPLAKEVEKLAEKLGKADPQWSDLKRKGE